MPHWTEQLIEPPWAKNHVVSLKDAQFYEEAAARGGSDRIRRHHPLSCITGYDRRAGTSGKHHDAEDEDLHHDDFGYERLRSPALSVRDREEKDWEDALQDESRVASVRDVKSAAPDYKVLNPKNHAFARYVLPVASDAFGKQKWPGKKEEEEKKVNSEEPVNKDHFKAPMSEEDRRFYGQLLEEMKTQRSFENNVAQPNGELKALDDMALQQLESRLSMEDQMTPDSWIPRSQKLVRLAGPHPLNAEVDLFDLFEVGMITTTKLHYVRSHGPVPQLDWETHRLAVFSDPPELIADPRNWTMDELANDFNVVELPITIACDGNRRKEMSMTKQSSGISFSASGVSTCLWRGIFIRDVLLASNLQDQPDYERWFLNFEGADNCSEGYYATSIPLIHAMDPTNDVMLAFGMNGRVLHPDHGYPLRVIIPGYVGGRQVKWVHKIWVTKEPNSSHYHIWDNRTLPGFITTREHPLASIFYHHENTACYEQTLQSVICRPAHNEIVPVTSSEATYNVRGFAYNGGGTAISRIELTVDGGKTWKYCFKRYVDKPLRHGEKHWAWIFWSCEVLVKELAEAKEISVRATDVKFQVQPEQINWNMLGMMNNSWYRVRPFLKEDPDTHEESIRFKHPVTNRKEDDGWMRPPEQPSDQPEPEDDSSEKGKTFSLEEITKHDGQNGNSAWLIIENRVYDVTSVLDWHPGGSAALLGVAGKASMNTTIQYKQIHDQYANSKRDECLIGFLTNEAIEEMAKDAQRAEESLAKVKEARMGLTLQPDNFTRATLIKRTVISEDTRTYQFKLPDNADGTKGSFSLDIGKHVMLSVHFDNQAVVRAYTPIAPVLPDEEDGTFTLCVKTYFPTEGGPYPPGGLISNYLDCMKEGEEIDVRGPVGEIWYKGRGEFEIDGNEYHFDKINLLAGGTGITPHWQLIHAILMDEEDPTKIKMINCNKAYDDILLRDGLDEYAEKYRDRFKLWHVLSKAPEDKNWQYGEGHLDEQLMQDHFYAPNEGNVVTLLCGPPGLIEKGALPGLEKIGFEQGKNVFGF